MPAKISCPQVERVMEFHLVVVGKTAFPEIEAGIKRYLDRLIHYAPIRIHVVRGEKIGKNVSEDKVRQIESERIQKVVSAGGHVVVWDQRGKQLSSAAFAELLQRLRSGGTSTLWMVIGGPLGLSPGLLKQADTVLSLSNMTFPHDIARLLVVEQVYRGFTILEGTPYHK